MENNDSKNLWMYIVLGLVVLLLLWVFVFKKNGKTEVVEDLLINTEDTLSQVDSVNISVSETFPVEVAVTATGSLHNGCQNLRDPQVNRADNLYLVSLFSETIGDVCTEALVPFEKTFSLNVLGLEPGVYSVDVNGVTSSFEIFAVNELDFEADKG